MNIVEINRICKDRYGCTLHRLSSVSALWLSEHIQKHHGVNVYTTIANYRSKLGMYTCFPSFNSPLFKTM